MRSCRSRRPPSLTCAATRLLPRTPLHLAVRLARKGAGILEVAKALVVRAEILEDLGDHQTAAASRNEAGALLRGRADAGIAQTLLTAAAAQRGRRGDRAQPGVRGW